MVKDWLAELTVEELTHAYTFDTTSERYTCIACGEKYQQGVMYKEGEQYVDAKRAVMLHIRKEHQSPFDFLIHLNKKYTGVSDAQKEMMLAFYEGMDDKEISAKFGHSLSTIRNYRFKLREKEKQAKVFLAMMELLQDKGDEPFMSIHKGATMIDERYATTETEEEKILSSYLDQEGKVKQFPSKEKRKIVILKYVLAHHFEPNKQYTEKEVNAIIQSVYDDFATMRRYFIEYGFLDRSKDGSAYWVKQ
ncbi:DUF2087 domain-containing protein [Alkalihalobacillus sp. LMS39]|uniref:DUF2087 domain-containing protein n=1 Tax=Alkalihalobacillus sp. LMS39 TaxID=2924032 RepID=UPI001FB1D696|nr:DUF2087 domain-containing protein [Alkalihalobacillus sp. LMS39]UOE94616.1 DUF2087 domain-containing protein [Alkalihalobacillus sp. LMS39]